MRTSRTEMVAQESKLRQRRTQSWHVKCAYFTRCRLRRLKPWLSRALTDTLGVSTCSLIVSAVIGEHRRRTSRVDSGRCCFLSPNDLRFTSPKNVHSSPNFHLHISYYLVEVMKDTLDDSIQIFVPNFSFLNSQKNSTILDSKQLIR